MTLFIVNVFCFLTTSVYFHHGGTENTEFDKKLAFG
jgi:hypothetical protein